MMVKPTNIAISPAQVLPEWRNYWSGLQFGTIFEGSTPYNFVGDTYGNISQGGSMGAMTTRGSGYNNVEASGDALAYFPYQRRYQLDGDVDFGIFVALYYDSIDTDTGTECHIVSVDDNAQGSWALFSSGGSLLNFSWRAPTTEFNIINFSGTCSLPADNSGFLTYYLKRKRGGHYELWKNGILCSSLTDTTVPVLRTSGVLGIGGGGANLSKDTRNAMGTYLSTYIWKGVVPENSIMLHNDPWGLVRQPDRLFLPDTPRSFGSVVTPTDNQRQPFTVDSSGNTLVKVSQDSSYQDLKIKK
jgi:hypothetical protein